MFGPLQYMYLNGSGDIFHVPNICRMMKLWHVTLCPGACNTLPQSWGQSVTFTNLLQNLLNCKYSAVFF